LRGHRGNVGKENGGKMVRARALQRALVVKTELEQGGGGGQPVTDLGREKTWVNNITWMVRETRENLNMKWGELGRKEQKGGGLEEP